MIEIWKSRRQRIAEDRRSLPKPNAVLTPVRDLFARSHSNCIRDQYKQFGQLQGRKNGREAGTSSPAALGFEYKGLISTVEKMTPSELAGLLPYNLQVNGLRFDIF